MNHRAVLQLIAVACDHAHEYTAPKQRQLLVAMFWVADAVGDDLKVRSDAHEYEHAISEIELIQDFTEELDLAAAFSHISDCIPRAIPLPDDDP